MTLLNIGAHRAGWFHPPRPQPPRTYEQYSHSAESPRDEQEPPPSSGSEPAWWPPVDEHSVRIHYESAVEVGQKSPIETEISRSDQKGARSDEGTSRSGSEENADPSRTDCNPCGEVRLSTRAKFGTGGVCMGGGIILVSIGLSGTPNIPMTIVGTILIFAGFFISCWALFTAGEHTETRAKP